MNDNIYKGVLKLFEAAYQQHQNEIKFCTTKVFSSTVSSMVCVPPIERTPDIRTYFKGFLSSQIPLYILSPLKNIIMYLNNKY